MRAVRCVAYGPPESLVVEELPDPTPGPSEIVVDVKAASVNFPDVLIIQDKYQFKAAPPFTPGTELAGVVRSAGADVHHLPPGTEVIAFVGQGAFAEQALVPARMALPKPPGVDMDVAASFLLAYGTSHHALADRGQLAAGETLLVLGAAGGVGLAAVEIGKAMGARVIAAASSAEKLALCRAHGADETIDYGAGDPNVLREQLKALTGGKGPDVIYDPVGGALAEPALRSIAWRGRYLVVGFAAGDIPRIPLNLALLKGCAIVGVFWGDFVRREPGKNLASLRTLFGWLGEGKLRPHVSARYPLERTGEALADMAARRVLGKIVITP